MTIPQMHVASAGLLLLEKLNGSVLRRAAYYFTNLFLPFTT